MPNNFPLWPQAASNFAGSVDALFIFLLLVSGAMAFLVFLAIIVFATKYRHRPGVPAVHIEGNTPLEILWTVAPLGVFMVIFVWGAVVYFHEHTPPRDADDVYVVAKQWMWKLEHTQGQRELNELHVPVGRDIRLIMTSQDVIHSFFIPAFRIKQDVLPGRYTVIWFRATRPGTYHLFCAEYCGTMHSGMVGSIVALDPADYQQWASNTPSEPMPASGEKEFAQLGCGSCHRTDGTGRGPDLRGVYNHQVLLEDGRTVTADDNYLRESITDPGAKVVNGYRPTMPTFQGLVNDEQLNGLVAYVKSLSPAPNSADGKTASNAVVPPASVQSSRNQVQ